MYKTTLLILFAISVMSVACPAQTLRVDSMKIAITRASNSEEKLRDLQVLCRLGSSMPSDTLKLYTSLALQLALQQHEDTRKWEAEYMYAFSLKQRSFTDSSLSICERLLKEITSPDKNFAIYNETLGMMASCLKSNNKIKEAAATTYQMLENAEKYNDLHGQINAYNMLTIVGGQLNDFDDPNANDVYLRKCITWYKKAIALFKDSSYYRKYDKILANLGITYVQLPKPNYDSAMYFLDLALYYASDQQQFRIIASCLNAKGNIFHEQHVLDSAEYYYQQEVAIAKQIGDPERIAMSYSTLRAIYHEKKDYKKALEYDILEREYCIKYHVPIDPAQYADFAQDYKDLGNYKAYGEMLDTLITIKDSLYQANSATALAEIQTKYEVQKKENTIIQQEYNIKKKRYLIYGISALLFLLIVVGFMILKSRKQKQLRRIKALEAKNELETRQAIDNAKEDERKRIIADLHDDVGGGLSTIRMVSDLIAQQNEQTQQLNEYALKISGITKDVTQRMNTIVWALNAENNTLQNLVEYIREYGVSFFENSSISFKSNLPEGTGAILLTGLQRKNIFLCVKEALNNIYKHSHAKNAWILTDISGNLLTVTIHDDGNGSSRANPFGNGLKNIQNRMKEIKGEALFDGSAGTVVLLKMSVTKL